MSQRVRYANSSDESETLFLNGEFKKEASKYDIFSDETEKRVIETIKTLINDKTHRRPFYVICLENKIVGYITGRLNFRLEGQDKIAELGNMYVRKGYRGKGFGTKLVKKFETWCKKREVKKIVVYFFEDGILASKFYQKLGFKECEMSDRPKHLKLCLQI